MGNDATLDALEGAKAVHLAAFAAWEAAYAGWCNAARDEQGEGEEQRWWQYAVLARRDLLESTEQLKRALEANGETWQSYLHGKTRASRFRRKLIALFS